MATLYTLKLHGDFLESTYADFVNTHLPTYEKIWSIYVGNDGKSRLPEISGITDADQKRRSEFSESHYTCLEGVLCMNRIVEKTANTSQPNVLDLLNDFMSFHAQAGRIRDNILKPNRLLEGFFDSHERKIIHDQFAQFANSRNALLHSAKLPASFINGNYLITNPAQIEAERTIYYNNATQVSSWGYTVSRSQYVQEINIYYESFLKAIYEEVEAVLRQLYPKIKHLIDMNGYTLPEPQFVSQHATTSSASISGMAHGSSTQSQSGMSHGSGSIVSGSDALS